MTRQILTVEMLMDSTMLFDGAPLRYTIREEASEADPPRCCPPSMTDGQRVACIVDALGCPPSAARILAVLSETPGRTRDHETVAQRIRDMTAEYPTQEAIRSAISHARKFMPEGVTLETTYSVGWRLVGDVSGWWAP